MKKLILLSFLLVFTLISCSEETTEDLSDLPYYSYLNDDNPVVTINIKDKGTLKVQLFPEIAKKYCE